MRPQHRPHLVLSQVSTRNERCPCVPAEGGEARPKTAHGFARQVASHSEKREERLLFRGRSAGHDISLAQHDPAFGFRRREAKRTGGSRRNRLGDYVRRFPATSDPRRPRVVRRGRWSRARPFVRRRGKGRKGMFAGARARTRSNAAVRRGATARRRSACRTRYASVVCALTRHRGRTRGHHHIGVPFVLVKGLVECSQELGWKHGIDFLLRRWRRALAGCEMCALFGLYEKPLQASADRRTQSNCAGSNGPGNGSGGRFRRRACRVANFGGLRRARAGWRDRSGCARGTLGGSCDRRSGRARPCRISARVAGGHR